MIWAIRGWPVAGHSGRHRLSGACLVSLRQALTAFVLYLPARSLRTLNETAPPWWNDVLIYSAVLAFWVGIEIGDVNLAVAGAAPIVSFNGIIGVLAMMTERRRGVRVYSGGRRHLFSRESAR